MSSDRDIDGSFVSASAAEKVLSRTTQGAGAQMQKIDLRHLEMFIKRCRAL
jgi:hypothetical protein